MNGQKAAIHALTDHRIPATKQQLSYSAVLAQNHHSLNTYDSTTSTALPFIHTNITANPTNGCDNASDLLGGRNQSSLQQQHEMNSCDSMDESIMIRPEFQRMEITNGGHMVGGVSSSGHQMRNEYGGARTSSMQEQHISNGER